MAAITICSDFRAPKMKSAAKVAINKAKRQHSEWEKILANEATDNGLISKVCIHLMHLNIKKPNQKIGRRHKQTFLQRYTDSQQTHENMCSITNYLRNANQNYYEVSPHTGHNGHHQKIQKR